MKAIEKKQSNYLSLEGISKLKENYNYREGNLFLE